MNITINNSILFTKTENNFRIVHSSSN